MKRRIRATFSAERNAINFELPHDWDELSQDELAAVLRTMARNSDPYRAKLAVLLRLTGMKIIRRDESAWLCTVPVSGEAKPHTFRLDPELLPGLLDGLNWLDNPGSAPVRLDTLHGVAALPAIFHDVPFVTYLQCENCFQGVLQSRSEAAVTDLARLLYPGLEGKVEEWAQLMVVQWWTQVKTLFAAHFPNFFKPSEGGGAADMMQVMNNQIRALTGGDITKEAEILAIDTWRALTELDAKAREADEFNRKIKKK